MGKVNLGQNSLSHVLEGYTLPECISKTIFQRIE